MVTPSTPPSVRLLHLFVHHAAEQLETHCTNSGSSPPKRRLYRSGKHPFFPFWRTTLPGTMAALLPGFGDSCTHTRAGHAMPCMHACASHMSMHACMHAHTHPTLTHTCMPLSPTTHRKVEEGGRANFAIDRRYSLSNLLSFILGDYMPHPGTPQVWHLKDLKPSL